jgi:uncharacterized iron-regulated membrane protein
MSNISVAGELEKSRGLDYRTVWRWHFYAGLFCIPFVLWLAKTGTIFLFHPQIQAWLDEPYDHLTTNQRATVNAQVQAAIAAVPGSTLDAYELPHSASSAAQVLVDKGAQQFRVYIHPQTLRVLKLDNEDHRLENVVTKLHGELFIGDVSSWIVELAASWAVIMILMGLFLWWPRNAKGFAGVLYPRLRQGQRTFWRDIHAVTGIYVSFFALFLLFTGLPWAKGWGAYLKAARLLGSGHAVKQDWTTSSSEVVAARIARTNGASPTGEMSGTNGMDDMKGMPGMSSSEHAEHGKHRGSHITGPNAFAAIDTMVATVAPLNLADPVLVSPPSHAGANWTAKSDTRDRPLRVDLVLDGKAGAVLKRTDFHSKPWLDRVISTGIAAHKGQLFGLANQMFSLFTTLGLVTLSLSGLVMWRRRKPDHVLGAPAPIRHVRFSAGLIALLVALGIYFPFLGASMILVALTERFLLSRIPATQRWLGLRRPSRSAI